MNVTTIGIDLAKLVFQVHGVDGHGNAVIRKQLKRTGVAKFFANLPACLIGMEACSSAHHWARKLVALGHTSSGNKSRSGTGRVSRVAGWRRFPAWVRCPQALWSRVSVTQRPFAMVVSLQPG